MGWKDFAYWLKGGIIGVLILTVLFVASGIIGNTSDMGNIFTWITMIASLPILPIAGVFVGIPFIGYILEIIYFFLIGALIGYIFEKVKNVK